MSNNRVFDAGFTIEKLKVQVPEMGGTESSLDELVHDIAGRIASDTNNSGLDAQIEFIVAHMGPEAEATIKKAVEENS